MNNPNQRAHAAHRKGQGAPSAEDLFPGQLPSYLLNPETDEVRELLEDLDDAVFEAISGSEVALKRAQELWPNAKRQIESDLLEESREQYLIFALEAVRRLDNVSRSPESILYSLDIILMLSPENG